MTPATLGKIFGAALLLTAVGWSFSSPADSPVQYQFTMLHAFGSSGDGSAPVGRLVLDQSGNVYGVTFGGGADVHGTVFELTPTGNRQWTESILHSFPDSPTDGNDPNGVIIDSAGNLYGTASGGINDNGIMYELSPGGKGDWTENILYNFCSHPSCTFKSGSGTPPTLGPDGSLYDLGGALPGNVFKLTPGSGGWTYSLLYTFCSLPDCADGEDPVGSVSLDAKGNLYGETVGGGEGYGGVCTYGCGTVFGLHEEKNAQWRETVLYDFQPDGKGGNGASGGVTLRGHGLYATTEGGGGGSGCYDLGCGTVFDLTRDHATSIGASEQVAHSFATGEQGISPFGPVEFDSRGDMFGVTGSGGDMSLCGDGCGVVYGLKPRADGKWAFAVLHAFKVSDGELPTSGLAIDGKGNLYGITYGGGPYGGGVAFELSPTKPAMK